MLRTPERFFVFVTSLLVVGLFIGIYLTEGEWRYQFSEFLGIDWMITELPVVGESVKFFSGRFSESGLNFLLDMYLANLIWLVALLCLVFIKRKDYYVILLERFEQSHIPRQQRFRNVQGAGGVMTFIGFVGGWLLFFDEIGDEAQMRASSWMIGNQIIIDPWSAARLCLFNIAISIGVIWFIFYVNYYFLVKRVSTV